MKPIEKNIKTATTNYSGAVHFYETGICIDKKLQWLYVTPAEKYTYYETYEKRGQKSIDEIKVLPNFTETTVHDGLTIYNKYSNCSHALCNDYILKELNYSPT